MIFSLASALVPAFAAPRPAATRISPQCYNPQYGTIYQVKIASADSDKETYYPGETMTVSGKVELLAQDWYNDGCNPTQWGYVYDANPSGTIVTFYTTPKQTYRVGSDGSFVFTYAISATAKAGPLALKLTAEDWGTYDGGTLTVTVKIPPMTVILDASPLEGQAPFSPVVRTGEFLPTRAY